MFNSNCGTGILPVMNVNGNNDNGAFGGDGWWAWILLFAIFGWGGNGFGWGNGGNGGGGNNNSNFTDAAIQRGFDNQSVMNKLNGIENGICSLGYDQLSQMNGIQNSIQQTGWNLQQTMNQNAIASMQQAFAASQQAAECCCENRVGQMNIMNAMDRNNCSTNNAINQASQQLMWANQQGFRDLSDQIGALGNQILMSQKDAQIAALTQQVNNSNLDKALQGTASWIVGQVSPRSQPAYLTCNPNTGMTVPQAAFDQWYVYNQAANCCRPQNTCCQTQCNPCCGNSF